MWRPSVSWEGEVQTRVQGAWEREELLCRAGEERGCGSEKRCFKRTVCGVHAVRVAR